MESLDSSTEGVVETLKSRGWCFGDLRQVHAIIVINSALVDDTDTCKVVDLIESELLNADLRSIGGKSLPDPGRKFSHIQGPKVLQISSVRDISRSSIEFSGTSSADRLLKLTLTDGHTDITAIEYTHIPSIPDDVVPGTKVCLQNKVPVHSGIVCLNTNAVTVLGGVVPSLHEEWQMNKKYSVFSRSSLRPSQDSGSGGPPPFEKLQIGATAHRIGQGSRFYHADSKSTTKTSEPIALETRNTNVRLNSGQRTSDSERNKLVTGLKTTSPEERTEDKPCSSQTRPTEGRTEDKPSSSQTRPIEVVEAFPVQNQAASQKLLQKMSSSNQDNRHSRGRRNRNKGKQEEPTVFTLDEWEKRKVGTKPLIKHEPPNMSNDEDLAWQLQSQLDLEDSYVQTGIHGSEADNIRMSMFSYERDNDRVQGMENRGGGRGRRRGRGRGRGRRRDRFG